MCWSSFQTAELLSYTGTNSVESDITEELPEEQTLVVSVELVG